MSLTAGLLVIVFAGFRMGLRSVEKANLRIESSLRNRLLYDRLAALIRSAYPYKGTVDEGRRALFFSGTSDSVGFVTAEVDRYAETATNRSGFRWIRLALEEGQLVFGEAVYYAPGVMEADLETTGVIDPDVDEMDIEYYEREADEETGEWVDSWEPEDHDDRLPGALRITLRLGPDSGGREVGPLVFRIPAGGPGTEKN